MKMWELIVLGQFKKEERLKEEVERLREVLHKVKLENQQKEIQLEETISDFEIKVSNSLIPSFQLTGSNTTRKRYAL